MKHLFALLLLIACTMDASARKYIFYLHGRIVEEKGPDDAVSSEYGKYDYRGILKELGKDGNVVISEARSKETDVVPYAKKVAAQIDSLMKQGVDADDIAVIGASKGGYIAVEVSKLVKNQDIHYVIMGACILLQEQLYGQVLAIHEKSDATTDECVNGEGRALNYRLKITKINTGKKHGFLYTPMPEWVRPAMKWIK
jgi:predicted S18 family serine protease